MERVDLIYKSIAIFTTGFVSWMVGSFGIVFTVLLGLMIVDFITGVMAGSVNEGINSGKGKKGLVKKTYIILLLSAVYMIELAILQSNGIITSGISGAFALMEFVSIIENGGRMGVKIPDNLKKLVMTLKNKTDEKFNIEEKKD